MAQVTDRLASDVHEHLREVERLEADACIPFEDMTRHVSRSGAKLDNGLLQIDLERPLVEPHVQRIEIKTGSEPSAKPVIDSGSAPAVKKRASAKAS